MQDLGAGGLSCAASETAAKAGMGMDVDIARVPRREPGMTPMEVMISESQERMLAIVTPDNLDEVLALCQRWEIRASVVGKVTTRAGSGSTTAFSTGGVPGGSDAAGSRTGAVGELLCDVPAESLGDGPVYDRPVARPADQDALIAADPVPELAGRFPAGSDLGPELLGLLSLPNIADSSWVWRQYDHQLFLNTVAGPGRTPPSSGSKTPRRPGPHHRRQGPLLPARSRARGGAGRPGGGPQRGLHRGPPDGPGQLSQLRQSGAPRGDVAVRRGGGRDVSACRALGMPVIGGNVSFYNESGGADIHPTPVVGVVGLIDRLDSPSPRRPWPPGRRVVVLGDTAAELGGSEWAAGRHGLLGGLPPAADLAAGAGSTTSSRRWSASGRWPACTTAPTAAWPWPWPRWRIAGGCGFEVAAEGGLAGLVPAAACFSESANRVVLAVDPARVDGIVSRAVAAGVPATPIGTTGGDRLLWRGAFDVGLDEAHRAWRDALPSALAGGVLPVV